MRLYALSHYYRGIQAGRYITVTVDHMLPRLSLACGSAERRHITLIPLARVKSRASRARRALGHTQRQSRQRPLSRRAPSAMAASVGFAWRLPFENYAAGLAMGT